MKKRKSNDYLESDEEILPSIISTLKRTDMHLPEELAIEIDKVLFDIMISQKEKYKSSKKYKFFDHYPNDLNFNLKKVEDYMKNLKIPD